MSSALIPDDLVELRGSYARILDLIADDGSRPIALASGAWISKQAISQRLRELEERGWVSLLTPDPTDGRATVVRRTAEGDRVRATMLPRRRRSGGPVSLARRPRALRHLSAPSSMSCLRTKRDRLRTPGHGHDTAQVDLRTCARYGGRTSPSRTRVTRSSA